MYYLKDESFYSESILCKTLGGIDVPLLTITNRINEADYNVRKNDFKLNEINDQRKKYKKYFIITARIHPGETYGSWMMQGFIRFITSNDKSAIDLRDRFIFKIVPMINIEGVILGNHRSCLCG